MKYNNLDETVKDVTFTHYVAHHILKTSSHEKYYYCIIPSADISFIEVSVLAGDWIVMGVIDLPDSKMISTGDKLNINPINQNNKQRARAYMFKNSQIKGDIKYEDFINQVYINAYQKNKLLLGMVKDHRYYIEIKNTHDRDVYYNINIRFADGR